MSKYKIGDKVKIKDLSKIIGTGTIYKFDSSIGYCEFYVVIFEKELPPAPICGIGREMGNLRVPQKYQNKAYLATDNELELIKVKEKKVYGIVYWMNKHIKN